MSRELSVERHIEAPVAHVWKTMIDRFEEWFCPLPWRAEAREIAWRPGGRSLVVMHGPNGEEILNEGIILDFQPELSCPLLSG
ncbi:SRPBCC domain-containing protein, partial [Sphingomonas melonis]